MYVVVAGNSNEDDWMRDTKAIPMPVRGRVPCGRNTGRQARLSIQVKELCVAPFRGLA